MLDNSISGEGGIKGKKIKYFSPNNGFVNKMALFLEKLALFYFWNPPPNWKITPFFVPFHKLKKFLLVTFRNRSSFPNLHITLDVI